MTALKLKLMAVLHAVSGMSRQEKSGLGNR